MGRCPLAIDSNRLHRQVRAVYERVARDPASGFHFHTGAAYAVQRLGYDEAALAALPALCTDRFAGVGNPFRIGTIPAGSVVLDHACGAGMDLLLAARAVGPNGRAIGVDLTAAMRTCAISAAAQAGLLERVELHEGTFEDLPVADASVDILISNGVLNLAPDKPRVLSEVMRVLRPGGALYLGDVVVDRELAARARSNADLWAACIGGASTEAALLRFIADSGLGQVRVGERFESFAGTGIDRKFHGHLHAYGVNVRAVKPNFPKKQQPSA
ncbi:methyltransferase domain-containing protein [Lysobacter sp. S4-A87]|uniref:methyltransferase domain-containing protein n=1 Tax=Lysobacter sp. S4-A87 TaxID=2925843 RepID=UPI001F52EE05|nr:methyltransferase domain-containing protein [Lysobacter sp. S4-A87]UNK49346.1 methyltransferase domain-containing protein [Lysobacter sp. S4-A87]